MELNSVKIRYCIDCEDIILDEFGNLDKHQKNGHRIIRKLIDIVYMLVEKNTQDEYPVPIIPKYIETEEFYLELSDNTIGKLIKIFCDKYGVSVVESYFDDNFCDKSFHKILEWISSINPTLDKRNLDGWKKENMFSGPRWGMYQSIISHCPIFHHFREHLYPIFKSIWRTKHLATSLDGASVYPPKRKVQVKDWPHIDQTQLDVDCYQSQVVLTDTSASFVCTPKSNLYFKDIVKALSIDHKKSKNFYKFKEDEIKKVKNIMSLSDEFVLGDHNNEISNWQIPITTKKGSLIFWKSNTIHSARRQIFTKQEKQKTNCISTDLESVRKVPVLDDTLSEDRDENVHHTCLENWRCVLYICMRPKEQFTKRNINTLRKAITEGRTTNHRGDKTFPKKNFRDNYNEVMSSILENPEKYKSSEISSLMKKLTFLEDF